MSSTNITFYASKKATLNITQLEPLVLAAYGFPVKTISHKLGKADPTINHHLIAARKHYGARNNINAVAIAVARGDIKFKLHTSYTATLRCGAITFALLAGFIALQDTPFSFGDIDHAIARTRHVRVRGHKGGKRDNALDTLIV